ncbi:hypothetical protein SAMN06893096_104200 [Geodermatophilus pulveris]|uniref:STAS domain-containing protein n=1 Tax=Geodermatophilus pulveris TaxID=1564159 RepID=A0A239EM51_9ACTN|nr:hypothetical protein SAMN06893096_104200 [Geodermatophilus pulveris]
MTALRVEVRPGRPQPVVAVTGDLGARGGPLLAALVEYVAATAGSPVAVDLGGVFSVDAHGVAPVRHSGVVVVAASAPVRHLLTALGAPVVSGPVPGPRAAAPGRGAAARPVAGGRPGPAG